jgi:hypothetical protein
LARKHCGRQPSWQVSIETLLKKTGSASPRRVFRAMVREIIKADKIPDYALNEEPGDIIRITPRAVVIEPGTGPRLSTDALQEVRRLLPGEDVYALEAEWRSWWATSGRPKLRSADRAFLGWVKKKVT